jgi:hypothetical protein
MDKKRGEGRISVCQQCDKSLDFFWLSFPVCVCVCVCVRARGRKYAEDTPWRTGVEHANTHGRVCGVARARWKVGKKESKQKKSSSAAKIPSYLGFGIEMEMRRTARISRRRLGGGCADSAIHAHAHAPSLSPSGCGLSLALVTTLRRALTRLIELCSLPCCCATALALLPPTRAVTACAATLRDAAAAAMETHAILLFPLYADTNHKQRAACVNSRARSKWFGKDI